MKWQTALTGFIPGMAWIPNTGNALRKEFVWNTQPPAATNQRESSRERVIALWSKYQRQDDPEVTQGDKIYRLEPAMD